MAHAAPARRSTRRGRRGTAKFTPALVPLVIALGSVMLVVGSAASWLPLRLDEVLGFVTGAACVWLTVKENIWSFPVGIANNAFWVVLFLTEALYADMVLQLVYIALGALGWYWWLRGGKNRGRLRVGRASRGLLLALALGGVLVTAGLTAVLTAVADAAPFLDALTTTASLAAQLLLSRKLVENWLVWMATDVVYVGLYASKDLMLTAVLYALFFVMCVVGLRTWRRALAPARPAPVLEVGHG